MEKLVELIRAKIIEIIDDVTMHNKRFSGLMKAIRDADNNLIQFALNNIIITSGTMKKYQIKESDIWKWTEQKLLKYRYSDSWSAKQRGFDRMWATTKKFDKIMNSDKETIDYINKKLEVLNRNK